MLSLPFSSISRQKYDVFLSFRGEDTRKTFTDHLYAALKRNGIITFWDDRELEAGEKITLELLEAIRTSWCSIIVFSETYASSGWCLDELAEIVEQKDKREHKIFPIFYDVDPSYLRKQTGRVAEAFAKHEERKNADENKIQRWRIALTEVANIRGWHLRDRHESEFIGDIVKNISAKLCQTYTVGRDELIGIDSRLKELHSKIDIGEDDVRIIGICGMGGIGKTTLARVVYDQMSPHFEGKSFLANVQEVSKKKGFVSLQEQLLSQILLEESFNLFSVDDGKAMISRRLYDKKVLIVIDDADNFQHLKCLVGRRDWFGLGSRIIVTTRDEHLLRSYQVDDVYKPTTLTAKEALRLFSLKAFNCGTVPENDFIELCQHVVEYADGLPLALEVLGCFLCGRDANQWRSAIERLKRDSNKEILDRLRISFDGLEETEKNIFLDIACFFNGEEKNFAIKVLDGCGFYAEIGVDVLLKKSLIKVDEDDKCVRMHNLLRDMGRKIVRQKCLDEPGKRCRLWEEKDVYHVLSKNTGTEAVEGMVINNERERFILNAHAFLKMKKLRLLRVFCLSNSHNLEYLPNELSLLEWHGYPLKSLPSGFLPDSLVALLLPYSCIEQLWKGSRPLSKLKYVNLKGSQNLIKTIDFIMVPNLEILILEGCTRIVDVHPSIKVLKKLKILNLRGCTSLRSFPTIIGMESLETLVLSDCSNLQRFPKIDREMECLLELCLDGIGIEELPSSLAHLRNLVLLNLKDCSNLVSLPSSIDGCTSLKTLKLSGCSKLETLPESLKKVELLEELDLSETAIRKPPSFIFQFKNLKVLSFQGCKGPPSKLRPMSPSHFKVLQRGSTDSMALMLPPLSGLSSLTELNLSDCNLLEGAIPDDICRLSSLWKLNLSGNNFMSLPATLTRLSKLHRLDLSECKRLKSLPALLTRIPCVSVDGCASLKVIANPSTICNSCSWVWISGINCYRLAENDNALTMLKGYIKVFGNERRMFGILIPGSEIPEWFNQQMEWNGSSINVPLPPNIRNDSRWMGVALCCVFVSALSDADDAWGQEEGTIMSLVCVRSRNFRLVNYPIFGNKSRLLRARKDHLWLHYLSRDKILPFFLKDESGKTENLSNTDWANQEHDDIVFSFILNTNLIAKVGNCGVRIVYEKDLEEMEEIQEQHSSPTNCADLDDIHQDIADDNGLTANRGVLVKRKRNIYEEAGPSDQSDSLQKRPRPKHLEKILNLISRNKHQLWLKHDNYQVE